MSTEPIVVMRQYVRRFWDQIDAAREAGVSRNHFVKICRDIGIEPLRFEGQTLEKCFYLWEHIERVKKHRRIRKPS